jgi:hypothetical protein
VAEVTIQLCPICGHPHSEEGARFWWSHPVERDNRDIFAMYQNPDATVLVTAILPSAYGGWTEREGIALLPLAMGADP